MKLNYDYKEVDWKQVKKNWDLNPVFFDLVIRYKETEISFAASVNKHKRVNLWVYIDGKIKGSDSSKDSPNFKFMNIKNLSIPLKTKKLFSPADKRLLKKIGMKAFLEKHGIISEYATPVFDNVAQIKKMVTALE